MFGVKVSTQVSGSRNRVVFRVDPEMLGVDWKKEDYIRVISNKDDNSITLRRVGTKAPKNVVGTLTAAGRGSFDHGLGIYLAYKPNRFKAPLRQSSGVFAEKCEVLDHKTVKFKLPEEIF